VAVLHYYVPLFVIAIILTEPAALILLILALLAWFPDRKLRWISIALPFLIFLQAPLAWGGRRSGVPHPLNAILVLALLGWLARRLWTGREPTAVPASAPVR
jgi:hypothetical protein